MTRTDGRVNPLRRPENRFHAAPALQCTCGGDCQKCHIAVDNTEPCYEIFQEVMKDLGTLQEAGLFTVAHGPSRCGKTSLLNRCATWATRALGEQGVQAREISLAHIGQGPDLTTRERVVMVGRRLAIEAAKTQDVFDSGRYTAPADSGDRPPTLEEYMRAVGDAVLDGHVLIVRTPRAEQATEVAQYWSGTSRKLLILAETTAVNLPHVPEQAVGEAYPLRLNLGILKRGDVAEFARSRIRVPGCGRTFPDLDIGALETFYGDPPMVTIGAVQKLLYNIYEHYLRNPWPDENIIKAEDLRRYIRENPEGQEG